MSPVVLDASVATKLLLPVPGSDLAARAAELYDFAAPSFLLTETANALWKYVQRGDTSASDAIRAIGSLANFAAIHSDHALNAEALKKACELNHPVYDCAYLALAERLGCPVLSADKRLLALATDAIPLSTIPLEQPPS